MSLAHGRPTRAIPGPSIIPDAVLNAMHQAAPNIYEGPLIDTTASVMADLKRVARTEGDLAMYIGNGHAAWEAALVNTLAPGDRILVLSTGRFGLGWADMARRLGIEVEIMEFGPRAVADPAQVEDRLRADKRHEIKALLTVQTDTASSVNNDIAAIGAALKAAAHPALYFADCIASLACERFEMDAWGVDVMVSACQKGLMTPPGVAMTWSNGRAAAARRGLERVSPYFDWAPRHDPGHYYQNFCGTAPTHHIFGLRAALDMILAEGLEAVWHRHQVMAETVWAAVDVWAETGDLRANIADRAARSVAVTGVLTGPDDAARIRAWCEREANVTLGIGLNLEGGDLPQGGSLFRIGHMGHLNPPMILGTLGTIDAGLKALGIAHGGGALRVASEVIAAAVSGPAQAAAE
ncbi:MAG: aminotransferase class V-fold PLP-dependent enzyme [Pseudomonadota bacterium]